MFLRGSSNAAALYVSAAGGGGGGSWSGSYSTEVRAFFDAAAANSGADPGSTKKTRYATLIDGLVSDGLWTNMKQLLVWSAADEGAALVDLKRCVPVTKHGTMTFTADVGYTGDQTSGYIDGGLTPTTAWTSPVLCTMGAYMLNNRTTGHAWTMFGSSDGNHSVMMHLYDLASLGKYFGCMNDNDFQSWDNTFGTQGMWTQTINGGGLRYHRNETSVQDKGPGSQDRNTVNLTWFGWNNNGTISNYSGDQASAGFIYDSGSTTDADQISNRLNAYMTSAGINVY